MCVHDIDTCILEKYHKVVSIFNRIDENLCINVESLFGLINTLMSRRYSI